MTTRLQLEVLRASPSTDPFHFASGRQSYKLRRGDGEYAVFEIDRSEQLLERLSRLL